MDNPQQKSGWGGVIALIFIIAAIGVAVYFGLFRRKESPASPPAADGESAEKSDINFEKTGNLVKNNPGLKADAWYLTYEEPGQPALNTEISLDLNSACLYGTDRELPCASLDFDQGEKVKIIGVEKDGVVTVKTLLPYLIKNAPWEDVAAFIADCQVARAGQTHDLAVKLWLKNDMEIWTEEPAIDDVITEVDAAKETCGEVAISTE